MRTHVEICRGRIDPIKCSIAPYNLIQNRITIDACVDNKMVLCAVAAIEAYTSESLLPSRNFTHSALLLAPNSNNFVNYVMFIQLNSRMMNTQSIQI
jgi:hypothetical protein